MDLICFFGGVGDGGGGWGMGVGIEPYKVLTSWFNILQSSSLVMDNLSLSVESTTRITNWTKHKIKHLQNMEKWKHWTFQTCITIYDITFLGDGTKYLTPFIGIFFKLKFWHTFLKLKWNNMIFSNSNFFSQKWVTAVGVLFLPEHYCMMCSVFT